MDDQRVRALDSLAEIWSARVAGRQRERERLARKYGPESPQAREVARLLEDDRERLSGLRAEADVARTPVPDVPADGWVVHGHVRHADRSPAPGLTVALYNEARQWQERLGYTCTDAAGYFALRYDGRGETPKTPPGDKPTAPPGDKPTIPGSDKATAPPGDRATAPGRDKVETPPPSGGMVGGQILTVRVTDGSGKLLDDGRHRLTPEPGRADYVEILLGEPPPSCSPPKTGKG